MQSTLRLTPSNAQRGLDARPDKVINRTNLEVKLTTRGRFAVTSMIDLALYADKGPVRLADVARRQKMSLPYLEQIFCKLRRAKLVKSVRGPGGGYMLARGADDITAGEIVEAVEGQVDVSQCQGGATCRGGAECLAHGLWAELNFKMAEFLNSQTLQMIKDRNISRTSALSGDDVQGNEVPVHFNLGRTTVEG